MDTVSLTAIRLFTLQVVLEYSPMAMKNTLILALFVAAFVAARLAGAAPEAVLPGAHLFVWGRVAYVGVYLAGIPYLRTLVWLVSVVGMFRVAATAL